MIHSLILGGWDEELANNIGLYDVLTLPLATVGNAADAEGSEARPMSQKETGRGEPSPGDGTGGQQAGTEAVSDLPTLAPVTSLGGDQVEVEGSPDGGATCDSAVKELAYEAASGTRQEVGIPWRAPELAAGSSGELGEEPGAGNKCQGCTESQQRALWTASSIEELVWVARVNPKGHEESVDGEVVDSRSDIVG